MSSCVHHWEFGYSKKKRLENPKKISETRKPTHLHLLSHDPAKGQRKGQQYFEHYEAVEFKAFQNSLKIGFQSLKV